jgi:hypothetical protein
VNYLPKPKLIATSRRRNGGLELCNIDGDVLRKNVGEELGESGVDRQLFDLERDFEERIEA